MHNLWYNNNGGDKVLIDKPLFDLLVKSAAKIKDDSILGSKPYLVFDKDWIYFSDTESVIGVVMSSEFEGVADAKKLLPLTSLKTDVVEVDFNGNFTFKTEKAQITLPTTDYRKFDLPQVQTSFVLNAEEFKEAVKNVAFAASKEPAMVGLRNILIEFDDKIRFVASDGFKLARYTLEETVENVPSRILLSPEILRNMAGFIKSDKIQVGFDKTKMIFAWEQEGYQFVASLSIVQESFPDYQKVFPQPKYEFHAKRKELQQALNFVMKVGASEMVKALFDGDKLTLFADDETGKAQIEVDIESNMEEFKVIWNGVHVVQILSHLDDEFTGYFETDVSPELFVGENKEFLVTPMRGEW